jgi:pimeloyl-ACP methyl ester carboxylesterase
VPRVSTPPFLVLPTGVQARELATDRGSFAELEAGGGRRRAGTAVLVPGFTGSKEDFIAVLAPLAAEGYHVVAYDQRGQFETPGLAPPEGWTVDALGADLRAVVGALGEGPVHVVGHSFGGLVARAAVLQDADAFASLTLMSSGPAAIGGREGELAVRMADALEALGLAPVWAIKQAMDLEAGHVPHEDPDVEAFLERRFLANDPVGLAAMARLLATEPDRTDELAEVPIRTLVVFGEGDDAWSPEIQRETASRLGARAVSFPEAAHSPAAESPKTTAQTLAAFWGETPDRV